MTNHKPVFYICQDGDQFFVALPDFVDLQASPVVWLSEGVDMLTAFDQLCAKLDKDPEFVAEYNRQAPEYELLLENIKTGKHPRAGMVEHIDRWGTRTWTVK